jgi:uncharacterized protein YxjI
MAILDLLQRSKTLFIKQEKNWAEIIVDFETANRYSVMDENLTIVGMIAERGEGFKTVLKRWILRSHRGFHVEVVGTDGTLVLKLWRKFFFFFSDLFVEDAKNNRVGTVHRRFSILYKKYDLIDKSGNVFARIKSPFWRLWTFPVLDRDGQDHGANISKKWGGALKEIFTDADTFRIEWGSSRFTADQKQVIFAAAISIDFDFFEKNQGKQGLAVDMIPT